MGGLGFPECWSELLLLRLLFRVAYVLGYVQRIISLAFNAVGLCSLLDSDDPWTDHHAASGGGHSQRGLEFRSVSAMMVEEFLPGVRYGDLLKGGGGGCVAGECTVCLYEFEAGEEVRRPSSCRHVFHCCCLDRWMEHGRLTCPVCRGPLFPDEMILQGDAFNDRVWAAAGIPDSYTGAGVPDSQATS